MPTTAPSDAPARPHTDDDDPDEPLDGGWGIGPEPLAVAPTPRLALLAAGVAIVGDVGLQTGMVGVAAAASFVAASGALLLSGRLERRAARGLVATAPVFGVWLAVRTSPWLLPLDIGAALALLVLGACWPGVDRCATCCRSTSPHGSVEPSSTWCSAPASCATGPAPGAGPTVPGGGCPSSGGSSSLRRWSCSSGPCCRPPTPSSPPSSTSPPGPTGSSSTSSASPWPGGGRSASCAPPRRRTPAPRVRRSGGSAERRSPSSSVRWCCCSAPSSAPS